MRLEPTNPTEEFRESCFGFSVYHQASEDHEKVHVEINRIADSLNEGFKRIGSPLRAMGICHDECAIIGLSGLINILDPTKSSKEIKDHFSKTLNE